MASRLDLTQLGNGAWDDETVLRLNNTHSCHYRGSEWGMICLILPLTRSLIRVVVTGSTTFSLVSLIGRKHSVIRKHQKLALQLASHSSTQGKSPIEIILLQQMSEALDCINE